MLLAEFLFLSVIAGPRVDPNETIAVAAGMLGVAAMAVQNALVQISVKGAPSTAVMTTNVTRFMMDIGELLMGRNASSIAAARHRAAHTWPAFVGFATGCAGGAFGEALFGLSSLALPTGFGLLALGTTLTGANFGLPQQRGCRQSSAVLNKGLRPNASFLAQKRSTRRQAEQSVTSQRRSDATYVSSGASCSTHRRRSADHDADHTFWQPTDQWRAAADQR